MRLCGQKDKESIETHVVPGGAGRVTEVSSGHHVSLPSVVLLRRQVSTVHTGPLKSTTQSKYWETTNKEFIFFS